MSRGISLVGLNRRPGGDTGDFTPGSCALDSGLALSGDWAIVRRDVSAIGFGRDGGRRAWKCVFACL